MTNLYAPSGETEQYVPEFKSAALLIIKSRIRAGADFILLQDLYSVLGAETAEEKTGVRWAVQVGRDKGLVASIDGERGIYRVL
jgi:hypothetical protein